MKKYWEKLVNFIYRLVFRESVHRIQSYWVQLTRYDYLSGIPFSEFFQDVMDVQTVKSSWTDTDLCDKLCRNVTKKYLLNVRPEDNANDCVERIASNVGLTKSRIRQLKQDRRFRISEDKKFDKNVVEINERIDRAYRLMILHPAMSDITFDNFKSTIKASFEKLSSRIRHVGDADYYIRTAIKDYFVSKGAVDADRCAELIVNELGPSKLKKLQDREEESAKRYRKLSKRPSVKVLFILGALVLYTAFILLTTSSISSSIGWILLFVLFVFAIEYIHLLGKYFRDRYWYDSVPFWYWVIYIIIFIAEYLIYHYFLHLI